MAGAVIQLEARELDRALAVLAERLLGLEPVLAEIGEIVLAQAQDAFEAQQGPGGETWEPSRRVQAQGGQTLVDSGQLLASLSSEVIPEAVVVGSAKVYAAVHQFGGKAGRGLAVNLPARPFLPDEDSLDWPEILDAVQRHLEAGL